jgi:hypothetical protein
VDDESQFVAWLSKSSPGEICTYHYGILMRDRQTAPHGTMRKGTQLDNLANAVMAAADGGAVKLVQRRIDEGMCQYLAVKN